jgi:hypothetical protein
VAVRRQFGGGRPWGRRIGRAVAVASSVLVLAGCTPVWWGLPEDPSVVVIGDSLTFQADGNELADENNHVLSQALADAGFYGYVDGRTGADLAYGREAWDRDVRRTVPDPDIVVIALGTNDMMLVDGETVVPLEPADACVRFIGVNEGVWGWGLDVSGPAYNAMLAEESLAHPDAAVAEWRPDMSSFPGGGRQPHADDVGDAAYRDLIVSLAEGCRHRAEDAGQIAER